MFWYKLFSGCPQPIQNLDAEKFFKFVCLRNRVTGQQGGMPRPVGEVCVVFLKPVLLCPATEVCDLHALQQLWQPQRGALGEGEPEGPAPGGVPA